MEFDRSKENIQPLRGGRNVTQLGVALQAQNDSELQRELIQQKEAFEEAIRIYEGDDPLDNWYNFVYWVEQSYPKHGHEGNLIPLLEDCLSKFENDERYIHDRRLCKLWIKYIDLQQNPLELFQLLYSKGICVSCGDLYRAWAFCHEVAGDYKKADAVFQLGLRGLAQPFEELNFAHQNMIMAIGREAIQGVDERRREQERHALTSLVSYNHNQRTMVPTVRIGNNVLSSTPGAFPLNAGPERSSNAPITLYEDLEVAGPSIGACASVSVLEVARKQEVVHKENTLKPGTWKKSIITKKTPQPRQSSIKVYEDEDPAYAGGIRLPPDFAPTNFDDFSTWKTDLFYPEPEDDTKIPMYPKLIVYGTPDIEYSPEEIRARIWFAKKEAEAKNDTCMNETMMEESHIMTANSPIQHMNTDIEEAVRSILPPTNEDSNDLPQNNDILVPRLSFFPQNISAYEQNTSAENLQPVPGQSGLQPRISVYQNITPEASHQTSSQYNLSQAHVSQNGSYYHDQTNNSKLPSASSSQLVNSSAQMYTQHHESQSQQWAATTRGINPNIEILGAAAPIQQWPNNTINSDENYTQNTRDAMKSINEIWKHSLTNVQEPTVCLPAEKPEICKFQIHEDTVLNDAERQRQEALAVENKSSNSQLQFSIYDESDNKRVPHQNLGPGGNPTMGYRKPARESIRIPFSSQPLPEPDHELPRKTPSYSEPLCDDANFVRPADIKNPNFVIFEHNAGLAASIMNESCTTQKFNFNLPHASTPLIYKKNVAHQFADATNFGGNQEVQKPYSKKLFEEPEEVQQEETRQQDVLSVILETTKEYRNSSSSSSSNGTSANTLKTSTFHRESLKAIPEISRTYEESMNEADSQNREVLGVAVPIQQWPNNTVNTDENYTQNTREAMKSVNDIWKDSLTHAQEPPIRHSVQKSEKPKFKIHEDTVLTNAEGKIMEENKSKMHFSIYDDSEKPQIVLPQNSESSIKEYDNSDIHNYSMVQMLLKNDTPVDTRKSCLPAANLSMNNYIDLTEDDSVMPRQSVSRFSEIGGGDSMLNQQKIQKNVMYNYESPMKNQFREMSCESSNDSLTTSPGKGHKMDVDYNSSQNSNSELRMEHESDTCDETILQKVPSDPFNNKLIAALLRKVGFPNSKYSRQYVELQSLPRLVGKKEVFFSNEKYMVEKVIGKGAFGFVYKATNINTGHLVALKYQKPANKWEYYITKEIQERCNRYMVNAFMDVSACFISPIASILVSDFHKFGSLLDLANKVKKVTGKGLKELISIYYAREIITIVNTLHKCNIIHGDIKPDNFLVTRMPPEFGYPSLQLIDFGNSIDMALFPKGTTFKTVVNTENFICTEMKDGRPWTYQTDIFCIAATVHVLLFDKYMQLHKNGSVWMISQHIPRYLRQDLWKTFFFQMLNIEGCDQLPDLDQIKSSFDSIISSQSEELQMDLRLVANNLLSR